MDLWIVSKEVSGNPQTPWKSCNIQAEPIDRDFADRHSNTEECAEILQPIAVQFEPTRFHLLACTSSKSTSQPLYEFL